MKNSLLVFIFCLSACQVGIHQIDYQLHQDSLQHFLQHQDLDAYFSKIQFLTKIAATELQRKDLLDTLCNYIEIDIAETNTKARRKKREVATNIANRYFKVFGDFDSALDVYLIAHENAQNKILLDDYAWFVENEIGSIYTRRGDIENAKHFYTLTDSVLTRSLRSLSISPEVDSLNRDRLSRLSVNLGKLYETEQADSMACLYYGKGLEMAQRIESYKGICANALGLAHHAIKRDSFTSAEVLLHRAELSLSKLRGDSDSLQRKSSLLALQAEFFFRKGQAFNRPDLMAQSIFIMKQAIDTLRAFYPNPYRREIAKQYVRLAEMYLTLDSLAAAEASLYEGMWLLAQKQELIDGLPLPTHLYAENTFIELLEVYASLYTSRFEQSRDTSFLSSQLKALDLALQVNDKLFEQVNSDDAKLLVVQSNERLAMKAIGALHERSKSDISTSVHISARQYFSRSKSTLLREKNTRRALFAFMPSADSMKVVSMQRKVQLLNEERLAAEQRVDGLTGLILSLEREINEIFDRYKQRELPVIRPVEYVEYALDDTWVYSLSRINGKDEFRRLGHVDTLTSLLNRMNEFIKGRGLHDDPTIQADLFRFLLAPVDTMLSPALTIIPAGVIGHIPFEMMRTIADKLVLEETTLSYAYDYEMPVREQISNNAAKDLFCFAPTYESDSGDDALPVTRGSLYPLPFAKQEADSIASLFGQATVKTTAGGKHYITDKVERADIFHYAGHAVVRKDRIFLAFSSKERDSLMLTGKEISLLNHVSRLVVLSACETGLGEIEPGEGIRSLGKSFMESGAEATVISLWNVNDRSTAEIMIAFYQYLLQGMRKDEALRKAKLAYISKQDEDFAHPYFWAGFIPAGEMRAIQ